MEGRVVGSRRERASQVLRGKGKAGAAHQPRGSGEGFAPGAEVAMTPRPALGTGRCHPQARLGARS